MCGQLKANKYAVFVFLVSLFLLTNLFRDLMPGGMNQITGGGVILFAVLCMYPFKRKELLILLFACMFAGIACLTAQNIGNHVKYFAYFVLNLCIFSMLQREKSIRDLLAVVTCSKTALKYVTVLFMVMLVVMMALPRCYATDLWEDAAYFQGFSAPHGVAGSCCLAIGIEIVLLIIDAEYKYLYLLEILVDCYVIVKTGTRTYLFSTAALLGMTVFAFVRKPRNRRLIMIAGIFAFAFLLLNSSTFQNKMQYALNLQDVWDFSLIEAITSSRSILWREDIVYFFTKAGLIRNLIGGGFDYSYEINAMWTYRIQAHNGFLEILLSQGLIGLAMYLYVILNFIKSNAKNHRIFKIFLFIYIPVVVSFDDILQAPSYMMSFVFVAIVLSLLTGSRKLYPNHNDEITNTIHRDRLLQ